MCAVVLFAMQHYAASLCSWEQFSRACGGCHLCDVLVIYKKLCHYCLMFLCHTVIFVFHSIWFFVIIVGQAEMKGKHRMQFSNSAHKANHANFEMEDTMCIKQDLQLKCQNKAHNVHVMVLGMEMETNLKCMKPIHVYYFIMTSNFK